MPPFNRRTDPRHLSERQETEARSDHDCTKEDPHRNDEDAPLTGRESDETSHSQMDSAQQCKEPEEPGQQSGSSVECNPFGFVMQTEDPRIWHLRQTDAK